MTAVFHKDADTVCVFEGLGLCVLLWVLLLTKSFHPSQVFLCKHLFRPNPLRQITEPQLPLL